MRGLSQFLLLFIVVVIIFIISKTRSNIGAFITWRRSYILAGIYLGILIISIPILYLLPDKGLNKLVETSKEAVNFESLLEGDLDKHLGLNKNSSQTFSIDTNKLTFNVVANMGNYRILVERKDVEDGEIDVRTYTSTQVTRGIEVTKRVLPPRVTLQNGTLTLEASQQQRLDFKQFNTDFTAKQLKNRNWVNEKATYNDFGVKVIYVGVPKSIELDEGNYDYDGQIQMLNSR